MHCARASIARATLAAYVKKTKFLNVEIHTQADAQRRNSAGRCAAGRCASAGNDATVLFTLAKTSGTLVQNVLQRKQTKKTA